jgi:type I restriction enzyme S subunit
LAHAFTDIVGVLFDRIIQNDMVSVTLAALRDALLPKLISGEIRVQDAEQFVTEGRI